MVKSLAADVPTERTKSTDKAEGTRRTIFHAALELFREQGFDGTTMQDIAVRAGVVKSAAYYYFPSKDAIIAAYYETVQTQQELLCAEAFAATVVMPWQRHGRDPSPRYEHLPRSDRRGKAAARSA